MQKKLIALAISALFTGHNTAIAAPEGGKIVAGQASIQQNGAATTIDQNTKRAIINWNKFDIGQKECVLHNMPDVNSAALHRVTGSKGASQLEGELKSNGNIFLVNPAGVTIHKGAKIDVGGFVASTADIDNKDFMQGNYAFTQPGHHDAVIINLGRINVRDTGFAALVAPTVRNDGIIAARLGKIVLASGEGYKLDVYGDDLINFTTPEEVVNTLYTQDGTQLGVENTGQIKAEGGVVLLTASQLDKVVKSVINNGGTISAASAEIEGGKIVFRGEGEVKVANAGEITVASANNAGGNVSIVSDGTVTVSGSIDAQGVSTGGRIDISGKTETRIENAQITAGGEEKGLVRLGGEFQGGKDKAGSESLKEGFVNRFGKVVPLANAAALTVNNSEINAGKDGTLVAWSDGVTSIDKGLSGKFVETSGGGLNLGVAPVVNERGTWLIDPKNVTVSDRANSDGLNNQGTNPFDYVGIISSTAGESVNINATWLEDALNNSLNNVNIISDGNLILEKGVEYSSHSWFELYGENIVLSDGSYIRNIGTLTSSSGDGGISLVAERRDGPRGGGSLVLGNGVVISGGEIAIGHIGWGEGQQESTVVIGDDVKIESSYAFHLHNAGPITIGNDVKITAPYMSIENTHADLKNINSITTIGSGFNVKASSLIIHTDNNLSIGEGMLLNTAGSEYHGLNLMSVYGRVSVGSDAKMKSETSLKILANEITIGSNSKLIASGDVELGNHDNLQVNSNGVYSDKNGNKFSITPNATNNVMLESGSSVKGRDVYIYAKDIKLSGAQIIGESEIMIYSGVALPENVVIFPSNQGWDFFDYSPYSLSLLDDVAGNTSQIVSSGWIDFRGLGNLSFGNEYQAGTRISANAIDINAPGSGILMIPRGTQQEPSIRATGLVALAGDDATYTYNLYPYAIQTSEIRYGTKATLQGLDTNLNQPHIFGLNTSVDYTSDAEKFPSVIFKNANGKVFKADQTNPPDDPNEIIPNLNQLSGADLVKAEWVVYVNYFMRQYQPAYKESDFDKASSDIAALINQLANQDYDNVSQVNFNVLYNVPVDTLLGKASDYFHTYLSANHNLSLNKNSMTKYPLSTFMLRFLQRFGVSFDYDANDNNSFQALYEAYLEKYNQAKIAKQQADEDNQKLQNDMQSVVNAYYGNGYTSTNLQNDYNTAVSNMTALIRQYVLSNYVFSGNVTDLITKYNQAKIAKQQADEDNQKLQSDMQSVVNAYYGNGYTSTNLQNDYNTAVSNMTVLIRQYVLSNYVFSGNVTDLIAKFNQAKIAKQQNAIIPNLDQLSGDDLTKAEWVVYVNYFLRQYNSAYKESDFDKASSDLAARARLLANEDYNNVSQTNFNTLTSAPVATLLGKTLDYFHTYLSPSYNLSLSNLTATRISLSQFMLRFLERAGVTFPYVANNNDSYAALYEAYRDKYDQMYRDKLRKEAEEREAAIQAAEQEYQFMLDVIKNYNGAYKTPNDRSIVRGDYNTVLDTMVNFIRQWGDKTFTFSYYNGADKAKLFSAYASAQNAKQQADDNKKKQDDMQSVVNAYYGSGHSSTSLESDYNTAISNMTTLIGQYGGFPNYAFNGNVADLIAKYNQAKIVKQQTNDNNNKGSDNNNNGSDNNNGGDNNGSGDSNGGDNNNSSGNNNDTTYVVIDGVATITFPDGTTESVTCPNNNCSQAIQNLIGQHNEHRQRIVTSHDQKRKDMINTPYLLSDSDLLARSPKITEDYAYEVLGFALFSLTAYSDSSYVDRFSDPLTSERLSTKTFGIEERNFTAETYYIENDNGVDIIVIGFGGTELEQIGDIIEDINLALNSRNYTQFTEALRYYEAVLNDLIISERVRNGEAKVIVAGHSLGGALAQFIGAVKGVETYAFNPAPVPVDLLTIDAGSLGNFDNIHIVRSAGDLLTTVASYTPEDAQSAVKLAENEVLSKGVQVALDKQPVNLVETMVMRNFLTKTTYLSNDFVTVPNAGTHGMVPLIEGLKREAGGHIPLNAQY
ncbi:hypothetical protein AGMMS50256_13680 [Betaproteobacteria bacterium]|nr:hypothetical protein AGMMS50256_13680 [Betaproteobacteria bacterium]